MHRKCRLWILPLLLILTGLRPASAGQDAWTPFGPGGGALQSLAASLRGDLYTTATFAATEIWQMPLGPVPGTAAWRWRNNGLGRPAVTALAVDPKNPQFLWAVSGTDFESLFHSTDAGGSWTRVFTGDANFHVVHLWVVPMRRSVVLIAETGAGRRLLRSANGGVSWTEVPRALAPVTAVPDQPGIVHAAAAVGGGVLRSVDGGASFRRVGTVPVAADDELRALHATYDQYGNLFASFRTGGLFRSNSNGLHWTRVGFASGGPSAIASEPKDPSMIYAIDGLGLSASHEYGRDGSFQRLAVFPLISIPEPTVLVAAPGGPYFLAGSDLYRYTGGFALVEKTDIESFGLAELRFHPADPSILAVRHDTGCIQDSCDVRTLLSTDGGVTFQRLGTQASARRFADVSDLAFDPVSTHRWLMAMGVGAVLSENGSTRVVLPGPVATVEISEGGILLAGGLDGVQVSETDGASWQTTLDNAGGARRIVDLMVNPFAPERVIARALETIPGNPPNPSVPAIYRSSDGGRTWLKLLDGSADVELVPGAPSSLYLLVSTANGTELRRSDDDGATTHLVHTFAPSEAVSDVAIDPSAPLDLYAASENGVLQSRDGGATWEPTPGNFNAWGAYRQLIGHVLVHPTERGHLFAVPADGGLFENQLKE
jgi:photosystem II stability/assembly factor-like uncharacterized protein